MTFRRNGWTKWALGVFAALLLALGSWAGKSIIAQGQDVAVIQGEHKLIVPRLERIENKLDRALERMRRLP